MESVRISIVNLNQASSSNLAKQTLAVLESIDAEVKIWDPTQIKEKAVLHAESGSRDAHIVFLVLPDVITGSERALIRTINGAPQTVPIIAVVEEAGLHAMMHLFELGITDFISPPLKPINIMPRVLRQIEHVRKKSLLTERLKKTIGLRQIIGTSPALAAEIQKIPFVAGCDSTVLISGETGTGKEMFARAIHYLGPRSGKPFMPINCGAIPVDLIENELFGHARGAFTGAATAQDGIISEADGGTLLLDEIDCLPPPAQVKLLRFLQEKEYRQLGSAKTQRADVRIIAATNIDLEQAVNKGCFRRDLYYRLNILPLMLPPLRNRQEDIPCLARHFVDHYAQQFNKEIQDLDQEAMQKLLLYDWPGNVRELQNVLERAVVFSSNGILKGSAVNLPKQQGASPAESFQQAKARIVEEFEKNYIHGLLVAHHGNITRAARTAGKNRRAFWELMRKHAIDINHFRFSD